MNKQVLFMGKTIKKAAQGVRRGQTPFGACIVKNGRIIACEHNSVWKDTNITAHAEINAIKQACRKLKTVDLSGCELYSSCEPCPMCFAACHWAKISKIYYGACIADAKKAGFNELSVSNKLLKKLGKSGVVVVPGVSRKAALKVFALWIKTKPRIY